MLWDTASTISRITFKKAKELSLTGKRINLPVVKAGGDTEDIRSCRYELNLTDKDGKPRSILVHRVPKISTDLNPLQIENTEYLFDGISLQNIKRPKGEIDVLVVLEYAAFHPYMIKSTGHLVLYENIFGNCVGGTHADLAENTKIMVSQAVVNHVDVHWIMHLIC